MKSIGSIVQGDEKNLFSRIYNHLQCAGCTQRFLDKFESHKKDSIDDLLAFSHPLLLEVGYWE